MSDVKGLDKVTKQLQNLKKLKFLEASRKGADIVMQYSKSNAPVDTGFLRDSHEVVETKEGAEVRVNANYAFAVEYGTSKMNAQPFLRPAIEQHMREVEKTMMEEAQQEIEKEVK